MSASGVPKKRRRWIWWVVLGVVVVVVAAIVIPMVTSTGSTTTYTTATVTRQTLQVTVSGSGNGVVSDVTEVQPSITGTVKDLSVKLGQTVSAGDLLFKIDNSDLDAAVQKAQAGVTQAKQQLSNAKSSVIQAQDAVTNAEAETSPTTTAKRAQDIKLAKQQLVSAKLGQTSAQEGVTSADTALTQAEDSADQRTVTAPVSGVITVLNAQNGQSLTGSSSSSSSGNSAASAGSSSSSAVEISNLSTLYAEVSINEVDLVNVKVGQPAVVTFDALPTVPVSGTVTSIAPTGISSSGVVTYNVDITLNSVDSRLRPTMSCSAVITTATRPDALVIPSSAVRLDSATQKNYVLVGNTTTGAISQVGITTGVVVGTNTEVLSGLTAGETVLIGGTSSSSSSTSTTGSSGARGGGGLGILFGRG